MCSIPGELIEHATPAAALGKNMFSALERGSFDVSEWDGMNTITASLQPLLEVLKHVVDMFPIVRSASSMPFLYVPTCGSRLLLLQLSSTYSLSS